MMLSFAFGANVGTVIVGFGCVIFIALRKLWLLLARFFVFYLTISFEDYVLKPLGIPHRFPRNRAETLKNPKWLYHILVNQRIIRQDSRFENVKELKEITTEPEKNATSLPLAITYSYSHKCDGQQARKVETLNLFVKFQTGKGMPLWLQAIRAAAEPDVVREVDFYKKLGTKPNLQGKNVAGIPTPTCFYADKLSHFNLVFVVLDHLDINSGRKNSYEVIPDHSFSSKSKMETLLKKVARMHGKFLGLVHSHKSTKWIPAKRGLEYCEWVRTLGSRKEPEEYLKLFKALEDHFLDYTLTLVHGDCRPGNMMFNANDDSDMLFADFEAVNAAPPIWDYTYSTIIGLPIDTRRRYHEDLAATYYSSLVEHTPQANKKFLRTFEQYEEDHVLLTIVLFYVSRTITTSGFWEKQGNTGDDLKNWSERVCAAMDDIPAQKVAKLLDIEVDIVTRVKGIAKRNGS